MQSYHANDDFILSCLVNGKVKWAIAGRSASKLMEIKSDIAKEIGNDDATKIETIIVDTM